jgi:predicted DNA-binding transcriptional regulator AlpA
MTSRAPATQASIKRHIEAARPASYLSRSALAAELDICETTVDEMVRRGVLPKPVKLSAGCVRWCWKDVDAALASLKDGTDNALADPFMAGATNVTKITEKRRGPA